MKSSFENEQLSLRLWVSGMRLRTLPASITPVIVGTTAGYLEINRAQVCPAIYPTPQWCIDEAHYAEARMSMFWWIAVLCVLVAVFIQIAVNFANDYSDGVRGTDATRTNRESETGKPRRLTASGLLPPRHVLRAAGISAALACVAGVTVVLLTHQFWLLALGAACLAAGWRYSGGNHPYGYVGFGELAVFVFFGPVAVFGTQYAVAGRLGLFDRESIVAWLGAIGCGLLSCVMLMVNNIRDIEDDRVAGKRTLAMRLGSHHARIVLLVVYFIPVTLLVVVALAPLVGTFIDWIGSWFGMNCGLAYTSPACAAGDADCSTEVTQSTYCAPVLMPGASVWFFALGGVLMAVTAVLLVRSLFASDYRRALALSSVSLVLFAIVLSYGEYNNLVLFEDASWVSLVDAITGG